MCTVNILEQINEINGNIMKLYIEKLFAIGNNMKQSVSNDNENNDDIGMADTGIPHISESHKDLIFNTFRRILKLITLVDSKDLPKVSELLNSLKDVVLGFPGFKKSKIDGDTELIYKKAIDTINDPTADIYLNLIDCKNVLFKAD
jgi:hypothetical protein